MTIKTISMFLLFICFLSGLSFAAEVKNSNVRQVGNRVLFEFDVAGEPNEDTEVNLTLTIKGKTYPADKLHLEGDFGKTKTGKGKKIYWNVLQDFPRGLSTRVEWDLSAGGGRLVKDPATGMELVFVKGGCYQMGDTFGDGESDEKPVHEVCVDDYYMGKNEVTQKQWTAIMGNNPSEFNGCDDCPVENVSWNDAQEFIRKLNEKLTPLNPPLSKGGIKGGYRLPTEAEWEYAARSGGKSEKYSGGNDAGSVAWYDSNSGNKTHPVGTKQPNGLGIYDMSGNVWEWVNDRYDKNYYRNSPRNNPTGSNSGLYRVLRGGRWVDVAGSMRAAGRGWFSPGDRGYLIGFRLALPAR
ncbi:MAG: formylglycine-generating enzyme family protein [Nitrospirae bacterium]|nr:formylglycine-generating enzyme family protein [Nitrospirota bacterium]MCL5977481.1 formylglycine-generating enzyme family protein [Nitrospirota bacterium]